MGGGGAGGGEEAGEAGASGRGSDSAGIVMAADSEGMGRGSGEGGAAGRRGVEGRGVEAEGGGGREERGGGWGGEGRDGGGGSGGGRGGDNGTKAGSRQIIQAPREDALSQHLLKIKPWKKLSPATGRFTEWIITHLCRLPKLCIQIDCKSKHWKMRNVLITIYKSLPIKSC